MKSYINFEIICINFFWILYVCLNRLRLSELQVDWNIFDFIKIIAIVPFASIIFYCIENIFDISFKNKTYQIKNSTISNFRIFNVLMIIIILLTIDLIINPIPLFVAKSPEELNKLRLEIRIPILYSFSLISLNVLIIFLLFKKSTLTRNTLIISAIIFFIFHSTIMAARGSVIYLLCSIVVYYLIYFKSNYKFIIYFIIINFFIISLYLFDIAGTFREGADFSIHEYGKFSTDIPSSIAWLWGYVIVNLDNLVLILNDEHMFSNKMLQNFSITLFSLLGYDTSSYQDLPYIGRFNLPTGFGFIAYDFGYFGVIIFMIVLFISLNLVKKMSNFSIEWRVGYIFFIVGILIFPISNWFISSRGILTILSVIILSKLITQKYSFLDRNEKYKC